MSNAVIQKSVSPNFGCRTRSRHIGRPLDAAIWGAELADGEGRERIYIVEPTGPIVDDPNLTDKKISWKSYAVLPLPRAAPGHGRGQGLERPLPRAAEEMKDRLERLKEQGVEAID